MSEKCELLETCGFFLNFKGNPEVLHAGWINLYCESKEKSEKCKRKEIRKQTGKAPPDNMTPSGKIIKQLLLLFKLILKTDTLIAPVEENGGITGRGIEPPFKNKSAQDD